MWKELVLGTAMLGYLVLQPDAHAQRDPLGGQFGAMEAALPPALAADDVAKMGETLAKLPAQRPGVVDTYILAASFWDEPVFEREAKEAAAILARRFDAAERTVVLSAGVGPGQARAYPAASPNNFNAVLGRFGKLIDPNEDLVIVFVTSHGGQDGAVAMQEKGRVGGALRALQLRTSLQQAGIRTKVLMVSACFSGHFILPFSNDDTVVLTAAAADKPSFGCEPSRDWTYFGDALFNHALRGGAGLLESFDQARRLIARWEEDLHAKWMALPAAQRQRDQEPLPSNPQHNAGDRALAVVAKAEAYGNAVACAGHLSFALDRARAGRPVKGFGDAGVLASAQAAAQARAVAEGKARGRSEQDTARAVVAASTAALQLYPAQVADVTAHIGKCVGP